MRSFLIPEQDLKAFCSASLNGASVSEPVQIHMCLLPAQILVDPLENWIPELLHIHGNMAVL